MPSTSTSRQPEILLLCDSAKIARAIEMILQANGHLQILLMDQFVLRPSCENHWDLILIAFSKIPYKPLDVVRQASLFQWVGCHQRVLIIAPDPFICPVGEQVWYLEFPFEVQTLSSHVAGILSATLGFGSPLTSLVNETGEIYASAPAKHEMSSGQGRERTEPWPGMNS